jgi:tetratricopeptide (TPR) repeat protein
LPKETRAELHTRFADWLDAQPHRLVEHDEIAGYHLEQAARCRAELGAPDEALSKRAAKLLYAAGRRATIYGDMNAADGLLSRAYELLPPGSREDVLIELADVLPLCAEFERAQAVIDELKSSTKARWRAYAALYEIELWRSVQPALVVERGEAAAAAAQEILSELGDERGLALAAQARFGIYWMQSRSVSAHEALLEMREHARHSGDLGILRRSRLRGFGVLMFGHLSVEQILRDIDLMRDAAEDSPIVRQAMLLTSGFVAGLQGRFDEAFELMTEGRAILGELGLRELRASTAHTSGSVALFADDAALAVRDLEESVRELEELGELGFRSTSLAYLAQAYYAGGEPEAAERSALASEEISAPDDSINFAIGRAARASVLADRGELDGAEELARSAVEYAFRTDFPVTRADALAALARVLRAAGREREAAEALAEAVTLYEAKGAEACVPRLFRIAGFELVPEL